jgi:hypothetical protein
MATVSIWQSAGEDRPSGHLLWKFRPIAVTLFAGFSTFCNVSLNAFGAPDSVGSGDGLPWLYHRNAGSHRAAMRELQAGDTLLHVGPFHASRHPWRALQERGVRTVLYLTEPDDLCGNPSGFDEIWSYTRRVLQCVRPPPGPAHPSAHRRVPVGAAAVTKTVYRYVPPGHQPCEERGVTPDGAGGEPVELSFMGDPKFSRHGRAHCWRALKANLGSLLNQTPPVYSQRAFDVWWAARGARGLHLSIHKYGIRTPGTACEHACCNHRHEPFESVRAAPLLSCGATLLAAQSYKYDEREYEGLVTFAPVEALPSTYRRLAARAPVAPDGRIQRLFRARFDARRLFERAGVYRDAPWNTTAGPAVSPASAAVSSPTPLRLHSL